MFHLHKYVAFNCFMLHVFHVVWRERARGVMVARHERQGMGRNELGGQWTGAECECRAGRTTLNRVDREGCTCEASHTDTWGHCDVRGAHAGQEKKISGQSQDAWESEHAHPSRRPGASTVGNEKYVFCE
jgi:hypothetical protein